MEMNVKNILIEIAKTKSCGHIAACGECPAIHFCTTLSVTMKEGYSTSNLPDILIKMIINSLSPEELLDL
jgi:hypothetical protein